MSSTRIATVAPAFQVSARRPAGQAIDSPRKLRTMPHHVRLSLLLIAACLPVRPDLHAQEWTRFRGPNGSGISTARGIPSTWKADSYLFQAKLPGTGLSSPVAWGDRVYLTSADIDAGRRHLLCLSLADGKELWKRDEPFTSYKKNRRNTFASATPAVDAKRVYTIWQSQTDSALLAYRHDGTPSWRVPLGGFKGGHGPAASPIVHDGIVYLCNDHEGVSFLLAVDAATGQIKWKIPRSGKRACYSTPCVFNRPGHGTEIIFVHSYQGIWGVAADSGTKNWEIDVFGTFKQRAIASPVIAGDLVIGSSGFTTARKNIVAVRPGKKVDEVVEVFRVSQSVPHIPTPLVYQGHMYLWADIGVVSCISMKTGKSVWRQRIGGRFFGSPICVDGRLYAIDSEGTVVVVAASPEYKLLGKNPLGEPSQATPAVSGGKLLLRTETQLIAVGSE